MCKAWHCIDCDCPLFSDYSRAKGICPECETQDEEVLTLEDKLAEVVAIELFEKGEKLSFSTGVCEFLTAGYGKLDDYGYWEFPLPIKYWPEWAKNFNTIG